MQEHIVIIHEDNIPRMKWNLGLITELFRGSDGIVRSAKLRTTNGETNRHISKLYPLEIGCVDNNVNNLDDSAVNVSKPKRQAAVIARDLIRNSLSLYVL